MYAIGGNHWRSITVKTLDNAVECNAPVITTAIQPIRIACVNMSVSVFGKSVKHYELRVSSWINCYIWRSDIVIIELARSPGMLDLNVLVYAGLEFTQRRHVVSMAITAPKHVFMQQLCAAIPQTSRSTKLFLQKTSTHILSATLDAS